MSGADACPRARRRRGPIGLALLVGLGISGAGAAFGPQVIRILGDKGQLVIETSDPGFLVEVKRGGRSVTIVDTASGRRIDLDAGDYDLELSEGKAMACGSRPAISRLQGAGERSSA